MSKNTTKLWAKEVVHVNTRHYCMKTLNLIAGAVSSLHYHKKKDKTVLCVKGSVMVEHGHKQEELKMTILTPGLSLHIVPGVLHRFRSISNDGAVLVEASTRDTNNDVIHLVPPYSLCQTPQGKSA